MNESFNPQVAAEKARETYRKTALQFEDLALNTPVSEGLRALAEKNLSQTREVYEHSKDALEAALETLERSFDALGQGATALNHKVMDIAQRNINSGFDLARAWRVQRTSLRPSNCKPPIGANSSTRSRHKLRRCARYRRS